MLRRLQRPLLHPHPHRCRLSLPPHRIQPRRLHNRCQLNLSNQHRRPHSLFPSNQCPLLLPVHSQLVIRRSGLANLAGDHRDKLSQDKSRRDSHRARAPARLPANLAAPVPKS